MHNMILFSFLKKAFRRTTFTMNLIFVMVLFSGTTLAQSDLWIPQNNLGGLQRSGAVSFSINGKIYIALGKDGSTYHSDLWQYDTISETWTQKANYPGGGRAGAFAFVMNNKAIAGTGEIAGGSRTNSVYKYEPVSNTWSGVAVFAGGVRAYSSAFSTGTRGFVVGGDNGSFQNDLWEYDINNDIWIGRPVFPGTARMKAVAFTIGNNAYYGTGDIGTATPSKDFWQYNIVTNTWLLLSDFAGEARVGAIGCSSVSKGYIGLGKGVAFLADFWEFDGATWTQKTDFSGNARELSVAATAGNKVYVGTGFGGSYYNDFYQWDPCAVPQITIQPVSLDLCEGTDAVFTVEISNIIGGETYEWLLNGSAVAGGTTNTLNLTTVTEAQEGSYSCKITNSCGTSVSDVATLLVTSIPVNAPTGLFANPDTLCPGNTFDLILTADNNGNDEDTLNWYSIACGGDFVGTGHPVNGTLIVPAPNPLVTTEYFARWENQCGATECNSVNIVVKDLPTDPTLIHRSIDTICKDYNDELFLFAEGGTGDSIAWYMGNICVNGNATLIGRGDTLDLQALAQIPTNTTTYSARWETYCGDDVFSSNCLTITITVNGEISITHQPQNKALCEGVDSTFFRVMVTESESLTPINYQWYFNGLALSGANYDTLWLTGGINASDSGYYHCNVYNSCDTLVSDSAKLTVNLLPSVIIQPTILDTICEGDNVTLSLQAFGSGVLQYQWYFNSIPTASVDTFLTINPVTFINSGEYFCKITNGCGTQNTDTVSFEVDTIPTIINQPINQTVCLNGTAEFNVVSGGTQPISYQWYKINIGGPATLMPGEVGDILTLNPVLPADTAFNYFCLLSNECFDGPSTDTVNLAIRPQVAIMDSIVSDTNNVCHNYSTYITLTVYGGEGDTLTWFAGSCGGNEIVSTTDTTLLITVPDVTTTYYARWSSPCGVTACDSLTFYVKELPADLSAIHQNVDSICNDFNDELFLFTEGGSGDSIAWYVGNICSNPNAPLILRGDTLDLQALGQIPTSTTTYSARWETYCGGDVFTSNCLTITITVNGQISIIQQPQNKSVCEGIDSTFFRVIVNENVSLSPINYQWYFNGLALTGIQQDTLWLTGGISSSDSGYYHCTVINSCDTLVSDSARLTVNLLPDVLVQPTILDTICQGDSLTMFIHAQGAPVLQYQWYFNNNPTATVDTFLTINPATFANSGNYFCKVTNGCGVKFTDTVSFEVDTIPYILSQPVDQNVCLNGTAEFNVLAQGTQPISYQWYKINAGGTSALLTGEVGNVLIISPVIPADTAFNYFCMLSNECFDGQSTDTVNLVIRPPVAVMDSIVSDTNNICFTYNTYIKLTVYGGEGDSLRWFTNSCGGNQIAFSVDTTLLITPPDTTTTYYAQWESACGESTCDSITIFVSQEPQPIDSLFFEDNYICYNAYDSILLTAVGGSGDFIYWYEGFSCDGVPFAITTDTFVYVHNIPDNSAPYVAKWVNACGESACERVGLYINDFTYIPNQTMEVEVCEGANTSMFVEPAGTDPFYFQWFFNGLALAGEINDTLLVNTVSFADTGMYYCQVWSECDTAVSDSIPLIMLELPYFTLQPIDVSICEGTIDTIQIKVAGDMPILVQWYKNNLPIGGSALLDTLLIINPVVETATYFARISNGCGLAYSDTITQRALDTLIILEQPLYQNLCLLDTAHFSVTVESTEFVEYAWYKQGSPTLLSSQSSLTIPNLDYPDEGYYYCIISDTCGELTTNLALLNMNVPPRIETDPFGATVCEGTFFQFEATVTGDSLLYQWNYNGNWIPDNNANILTFDPIERGDEGTYFVHVSNNCGEDESIPVNLFVQYLPNILESLSVTPDTVCPICEYDSLTLIAVGDGGGYGDYIEWYENDVSTGSIVGTGATLVLPLPTTTTTYFARWVNECTATSTGGGTGGGSTEALSITVVYQGDPVAPDNVNVNVNNFCITYGEDITLFGVGGYGDILKWYIIENQTETYIGQGTPLTVPQPMDTTIYAARWINHCGQSDSTIIQVNVVPLPEVIVIASDTLCGGQPYQISNVFVNHLDSLRWTSTSSSGVFDTATIQYPIYTDLNINFYDTIRQYLILTAFGKADCEDAVDSILLVYLPIPSLSIDPVLPSICRDSSIIVTATGAEDYFWQSITSDEETKFGNPANFSPEENTNYYLVGISSRGCVDSLFMSVDVYPTPYVDLGDSVFLYSCEPVQLDAGGGDGSEYYIWNNGYRTRSITVYETGNYFVIVGNPGCEVSDTGYISLCNGRIFMPNAFSPNEDGLNETFKPITSDPTVEFRMMIFDRLGQMIFETNDIHNGWDGTTKGDPCPVGNYVWRIDYQGQGTDSPGKKGSEVGTVMLVR